MKRSSYDVPVFALPEQFKNKQVVDATPEISVPGNTGTVVATPAQNPVTQIPKFRINEWWKLFNSHELSALIDRGMANNPDIRIATLHISQAQVRAGQARAGQFPTLDAAFSGGPQRGSSPASAVSGLTLNGAWKIDVWGENASLAEEAKFQLWQAVFDANNTKRTIAASIATSYIQYLLSNARLKISRETEKTLISMLSTIEKRAALGDATVLELEQQRSAIYSELSRIPTLELQREEAIESLAYLVGTVPGALKLSDADLDSLQVPEAIPDLPSSMLLRRPDVRSVEARLLAADVDIDVMRARLLPSVGLTTQTGYSGLMSQLLKPQSFFWNTFANVTTNVFDAGRLSSNVQQSALVHEEMIETYARTILQAVREVERALYSVRVSGQRTKLENEAITFAQRAWNISNKIYGVGGVDFMALQETQRTYRRYMEEYQQIRSDYYLAYVGLFLSLGGGEDMDDGLPGKGQRPQAPTPFGNKSGASDSDAKSPGLEHSGRGSRVMWKSDPTDVVPKQETWQVALSGHYQRKTIDAVLRDLQLRYPSQMADRNLYPSLEGRLEDGSDAQASWYRLNVARFGTAAAAHDFCKLLQADMQRCQVISSHSAEPVAEKNWPAKNASPTGIALAPTISIAGLEDKSSRKIVTIQPEMPRGPAPVPVQVAETKKLAPDAPVEKSETKPETAHARAELPAPTPATPEEHVNIPLFWKIDLTDRVLQRKVAGMLHDLQTHFPAQMKQKNLYMTPDEQSTNPGHPVLYRLQIGQFDTARAALDFCQLLRTGSMPCQIYSTRSDKALADEAISGK